MNLLNEVILWVHLFSAILFVGGSFFMWIVIMPISKRIANDESERTRIISIIARRFGKITNIILGILILTGIYNATWYLGSVESLFRTYSGNLLLIKIILTLILIILIYYNNRYIARKIVKLAEEKRYKELSNLRKLSRPISFINLALMIAITFIAVMMQFP